MNTLFIVTMALIVLAWGKWVYLKVIEQQTKYRLYAIRDELRRKAISGEVSSGVQGFEILDHTISRSIAKLFQITMARTLFMNFFYNSSGKASEYRKKVEEEIKIDPVLKKYLKEYNKIMFHYVVYQHGFSAYFLYPVIRFIAAGTKTIGFIRKLTRVISSSIRNATFFNTRSSNYDGAVV